jgi:hypothetical protein
MVNSISHRPRRARARWSSRAKNAGSLTGDLLEPALILFAEHVPSPHVFSGSAAYPLRRRLTLPACCYFAVRPGGGVFGPGNGRLSAGLSAP